jgi:hypothetical protein
VPGYYLLSYAGMAEYFYACFFQDFEGIPVDMVAVGVRDQDRGQRTAGLLRHGQGLPAGALTARREIYQDSGSAGPEQIRVPAAAGE